MTVFYSPEAGGFYTEEIHGADGIPADAVEITQAEHAALLDAQSAGKIIKAGAEGKPVASDPPAPSDDQLAASARRKRDRLIADVMWRYERHARETRLGLPLSDDIVVLDAYVRGLCDVPEQAGFPASIAWPDEPA